MTIRHRLGAYPIIFTALEVALDALPRDAKMVTDSNLDALYGARTSADRSQLVVPAGERSKSMAQFQNVIEWLAESNTKRNQSVVAFGGGVIGDLVGFAAGSYMRGVPLIQVPTSLLAMVDSSVGGKVGIDLPAGKNLVGMFKPPSSVYVCHELLTTLPEREFRSGLAEVLKYGFIMDEAMIQELSQSPLEIGDSRLCDVIRTCIQHKAFVVERDEYETSGLRATLNFGHTVGHAIETLQGYADWLHGEAISAGMVAEAHLAESLRLAPPGTRASIEKTLAAHGLPVELPAGMTGDVLVEAMHMDKKAGKNGLAFSLVTDIGTCKLVPAVDTEHVRRTLNELTHA